MISFRTFASIGVLAIAGLAAAPAMAGKTPYSEQPCDEFTASACNPEPAVAAYHATPTVPGVTPLQPVQPSTAVPSRPWLNPNG